MTTAQIQLYKWSRPKTHFELRIDYAVEDSPPWIDHLRNLPWRLKHPTDLVSDLANLGSPYFDTECEEVHFESLL